MRSFISKLECFKSYLIIVAIHLLKLGKEEDITNNE